MNKIKNIGILLIIGLFLSAFSLQAAGIDERLAGYIVLQVEQNGEAWYIHPDTLMRYYLGRPAEALKIMREQGVGITNADLNKIPIGLVPQRGKDSDKDGLGDDLEKSLGTSIFLIDTDKDNFSDKEELNRGYNPLGKGSMPIDLNFASKQAGKIFLQVESQGEAWYVYPQDNKRYYLGRPEDAFSLMRALSKGISDNDIDQINTITPVYDVSSLESKMFALVNLEREKEGLSRLKWNGELAKVARMHSEDLATENETFTALGRTCDYPIIHHEGKEFGLYNDDRLKNSSIYYYSRTGENIALVSSAYYSVSYAPNSNVEEELDNCDNIRHQQEQKFLSAIENAASEEEKISILETELTQRTKEYLAGTAVEVKDLNWRDEDKIAADTVKGWMDSPGHRANVLNPEYDEAGMGLRRVNGYVISSQIFIKRASCGYVGGECCQEEGYYPYCFLPNTCSDSICQ